MKNCLILYFVVLNLLTVSCSKRAAKVNPDIATDEPVERYLASDEDFLSIDEEDSFEISEEQLSENKVYRENLNMDLSGHQEVLNEFVDLKVQKASSYRVEKGDTLMLISFKVYGTTKMWKVLAKINEDKIGTNNKIVVGSDLYLPVAKNPYKRPIGNPYLIKSGDSLSLVSDLVYGDYKKWPVIWKNNRTMVNDPNLIFAGFTLFYPDLDASPLQFALH